MTAPVRLATTYSTHEHSPSLPVAHSAALPAAPSPCAPRPASPSRPPTPWVMGSPSVDFLANGVSSNQVIHLTKAFKGGGELLAVDSVTETFATLRWPGQGLNVGHPPGFGGKVAVEFSIRSMSAQIENACFEINERFGIDPNLAMRSPASVYDLRILRDLTVYAVLYRAYANGNRDEHGDWKLKVGQSKSDYDDALARATLRWGPKGTDQPTTTRFGTRLSR